MSKRRLAALSATLLGILVLSTPDGLGQPGPKGDGKKDFFKGPGGPFGGERKVVKDFDRDGDKRLNADERKAAREALKKDGGPGRGFGGPKGGFGMRGKQDPPTPGPKVNPADAPAYPDKPLYEPTVLRTLFLEFENADWEAELQDFHGTDVEVPCALTVDGKKYPNVGVHFRGMSSYMGVGAGYKRSLDLSLDFADARQRLYGAKTLNLLNSHEDASLMSSVLYSHIARQYIPAPKANFVKVVINGESWGVYASVQQFDKEFLKEHFKTDKGTRWKVRGSPGGQGGLEYVGDKVEDYKRRYEVKGGESDRAWKALMHFCKVLNQTPPEKLEEALKPIADLDGLLWFLALDVALVNNDGYWIRASDYSLYLDDQNKFHVIPHDMNESFRPGGGPGGGMMFGPRAGEVLPGPMQDMLGLSADQRKQVAELQKDVDGRLEKILTEDQRKQFREMRDRGPGRGPGGFGPGGLPPGGPMPPPPPGGPGGPGGPMRVQFGPGGPGGAGGIELDPLVGLTDTRKPLRSKLLAVPSLKAKYLQNVRTIAEKSLDWKALGPVVAQYRKLIEREVEADTRKLDSFEAFQRMTADASAAGGRGREVPLRAFADQRRKYLIDYKEPKPAAGPPR
jgi:spore coat protein CotH